MRRVPVLKMLTDAELLRIDQTSRDILWEIGTACELPEALDYYEAAGCHVDREAGRVRIPDHVISKTIAMCASEMRLYNRKTGEAVIFGGDNVNFGSVGVASNIFDIHTDEFRVVVEKDVADCAQLADTLEHLKFMIAPCTPSEAPTEISDLVTCKNLLLNTSKPIFSDVYSGENARKVAQMAYAVAGGKEKFHEKPFLAMLLTLTSPLHMRDDVCEAIIEGGKEGLGAFIESGPMSSGTGPATLALNIAMANAEVLAAFVLAKAVNPEMRLIHATWARILDMKFAACAHGGPEFAIQRVASAQLAKYYGFPSGGGCILGDSKSLDIQLGMEKMGTGLFAALAGLNFACGMGLFADENAICLESFIIDNEICGWIEHALKGIRVDEESLNFDIIKEVGPKGHFVTTKHTRQHYKTEHFQTNILDRGFLAIDKEPDKATMRKRAKALYPKLLAGYEGPEVSQEVKDEIDEIIGWKGSES